MNDERNDATDQGQNREPHLSASADTHPTEADEERVSSEEARSAAEQQNRDEVRQGLQQEQRWSEPQDPGTTRRPDTGRSEFWTRVRGMLSLEPGIVQEIASDPNSFKQGLIVLASAVAVGHVLVFPLIPLLIPVIFVGIAFNAFILRLTSRLFSKQVPEYRQWLRAFLFVTTPIAFWLIPLVGHAVGGIYQLVLTIVVTRAMARLTIGRAVLTVLLPNLIMAGIGFVVISLVAARLMSLLGGL